MGIIVQTSKLKLQFQYWLVWNYISYDLIQFGYIRWISNDFCILSYMNESVQFCIIGMNHTIHYYYYYFCSLSLKKFCNFYYRYALVLLYDVWKWWLFLLGLSLKMITFSMVERAIMFTIYGRLISKRNLSSMSTISPFQFHKELIENWKPLIWVWLHVFISWWMTFFS